MSIDLSKLSVTELHEIFTDLTTALDRHGVSQAHDDYFYALFNDVQGMFYEAKARTAKESLLKLMELGKEDIGSGSIFGPSAISEAQQFVGVQA